MILESLPALLHRILAQIARKQQLDGALDILRRESRLAIVDDKHASLRHDVIKAIGDDRVHRLHALRRDGNLLLSLVRLDLLQEPEDVRVEGTWVVVRLGFLLCSLFLLLELRDAWAFLNGFLLLINWDDGYTE